MLTGWDVQYLCNDQHVKEIGVWIDNWVFDTPTPGGPGRIRYRFHRYCATTTTLLIS